MNRYISIVMVLAMSGFLMSSCAGHKSSGAAGPTTEETIVFEYKEQGIKNTFYINEAVRLPQAELAAIMPEVKAVWSDMVAALAKKDIETALLFFSPKVRKGFRGFLTIGVKERFDEMIPLLQSYRFSPWQGTATFVQCHVDTGSETDAPDVVFERVDGDWKIGFL